MDGDSRLGAAKAGPPFQATAAPARFIDARKVEAGTGWHRTSRSIDATYSVLPIEPPKGSGGERRRGTRLRTRLRSGKVIGSDGNFIVECLIHNRSATGCRLRLSSGFVPPPEVYLYEDQSGDLFHAIVVWRKERDLGLRLAACAPTPAHRALAGRMRRKYYALGR